MLTHPYYTFLFGCFAIALYMISVDKNVADFVLLLYRFAWIQASRAWFTILIYPRLRFETFLLKRNMHKVSKKHMKMAKDLLEELNGNESQ
jgi:ABC-type multidrug transport system fused ATPase/permease subunit